MHMRRQLVDPVMAWPLSVPQCSSLNAMTVEQLIHFEDFRHGEDQAQQSIRGSHRFCFIVCFDCSEIPRVT